MTEKRKLVQNKIFEYMDSLDDSGYNRERYEKMFANMSDKEFDNYMNDLKDKRTKLMLFTPNMKVVLKMKNIIETSKKTNSIIFDRIWMVDPVTKQKYLTNYKYLILRLPIRRTRQFLMHKLSVAESDKRIDSLTGQVVKPDAASSISFVEAQLLYARGGLEDVLVEFMKVRGGDIHAYAKFKQQLEENGSAYLSSLDDNTRVRSAIVMSTILKSMLLDNNLAE